MGNNNDDVNVCNNLLKSSTSVNYPTVTPCLLRHFKMSIQFLKTESMNGTLVHRHTKHSFQFKTPFGAMPSFAKFYPFPRKKRKENCPCFVVFSFVDNQNDKNS